MARGSGGLIVTEHATCDPGQTDPMTIVDIDPVSGQPLWQVKAAGIQNGQGIVYCYSAAVAPQIAIRPDGWIVMSEPTNAGLPALMQVFNGAMSSITIPDSSFTDSGGVVHTVQSITGPPIVDSDGSTYVEYQVRDLGQTKVNSATLYLLKLNLNWAQTTTQLMTTSQLNTTQYPEPTDSSLMPGRIIPDGQGGVLAAWTISPSNPPFPPQPWHYYQAAHVVSGAVSATYDLPFTPSNLVLNRYPTMVLGEGGTALVTDGRTDGPVPDNGPKVVSFGLNSGSVNWSYQTANQQSALSIMAVTSDGGLAINDSQGGIIPLGPNGAPGSTTGSLGDVPKYSWSGNWYVEGAQGASRVALSLDVDPAAIWGTPNGNPSQSGWPGALCPCLLQSPVSGGSSQAARGSDALEEEKSAGTDERTEMAGIQAALGPPPADCPFCTLVSPQCSAPMAGGQSTYVIVIGDEGANHGAGHNWDMGYTFPLAAQQRANDLNAQGHRVIACRATTVQDFNHALTSNGLIDGGVIYFGHSGRIPVNGVLYSALFVGQDPPTNENMYAGNVMALSNAQLGNNAAIWLNGCDGGTDAPGGSSIAQLISNQLNRGVYAYDVGVYFSSYTIANDPYVRGDGRMAPGDLPVYAVPEGTPHRKPDYIPFTPYVLP